MMNRASAANSGGSLNGAGFASRLTITKKFILWSVLLLQIGFIGCIWLLQTADNNNTNELHPSVGVSNNLEQAAALRVNFIKQLRQVSVQKTNQTQKGHQENMNNYRKDFFKINYRLNRTEAEYEMSLGIVESSGIEWWCYREGTLNETAQELDTNLAYGQCKCQTGWHGKDCGQPEIIWRALMMHNSHAGSAPIKLHKPNEQTAAHRLVYMHEFNYVSLELLELQVRALIEVVDYFLVYYVSTNKETQSVSVKSLERSLSNMLGDNGRYLIYNCAQWRTSYNCSTANAYRYFKRTLKERGTPLDVSDLLLYTNAPAIFGNTALKFFKYYAADVLPIHFRLKYNVYGFYWQHPQLSARTGVISSLAYLKQEQFGNDDPKHLQSRAHGSINSASYTIGDLNHFGGWYCEYCQQPDELVLMLQTEAAIAAKSSLQTHIKFPNATRSRNNIDAAYLQQLIAHGIYVDGKTQLIKLRQYADKYYAPTFAIAAQQQQNVNYAHLLVNLYESLDEIDEDGVY